MQATERLLSFHNWIAIFFVFCLLILFLLKLFNAEKMKGHALSLFNKGFVEIAAQEKSSVLSLFDIGFIAFSFLTLSLTVYFGWAYTQNTTVFSFVAYSQIASYVLIYSLGRNTFEMVFSRLLNLQELLGYFFFSKRSYLYSISIGLFFLNVVYFYGFQEISLLLTGFVLLFSIRLALIVVANKNLIIKELFYFILYLCAFEIAPLLILFKLIF